MPPVPAMSGRDVVKTFQSLGWHVARQSGSHIAMEKAGQVATRSVPDRREVRKGTLRGLIRAANLTVAEFIAAT